MFWPFVELVNLPYNTFEMGPSYCGLFKRHDFAISSITVKKGSFMCLKVGIFLMKYPSTALQGAKLEFNCLRESRP